MAQLLAGQGHSAEAIATQLGIPRRIARAAVANRISPGSMRGIVAAGWLEQAHGSGAARYAAVQAAGVRAKAAFGQAIQQNAANPTPANQAAVAAARQRFEQACRAYGDQPIENDAYATGSMPMPRPALTRGAPLSDQELFDMGCTGVFG